MRKFIGFVLLSTISAVPTAIAQSLVAQSNGGKQITLPLSPDKQYCGNAQYSVTIFDDHIDIIFRSGTKSFALASDGSFGGRFQSYGSTNYPVYLVLDGNAQTKKLKVTNLEMQCTWSGVLP